MDTVFIIGSGHDRSLCTKIAEREAEYLRSQGIDGIKLIECAGSNIHDCLGCEYCLAHQNQCVLSDEMEIIYDLFRTAKRIVFVSPVYFSNIPSVLKRVVDRCQMFYNLKDKSIVSPKKFLAVHIGGAPNYPDQFKAFELTYKVLLPDINAKLVDFIGISNTDKSDPLQDPEALERIREGTKKLISG